MASSRIVATTKQSRGLLDFSRRDFILCVGMASLWFCLQSSGYYPLSVADYRGTMAPSSVAFYHLIYGASLVVFSVAAAAARGRAGRLLGRPAFVVGSGALGVVGHGLLWWFGATGAEPEAMMALGAVLVALFVVVMVLSWGRVLVARSLTEALGVIAASFLLAQVVVMAASLTGADQCACVFAASAVCVGCSALQGKDGSCRGDSASGSPLGPDRPSFFRTTPWGMAAPALLLLYFCEIFIRLRSGYYLGAVDPQRQVITGAIAFVTFAIIALVLARSRQVAVEKRLILVFSLLMVADMLALVGMLIFDADNRYVTNRILVACSHCDEAFLWMILVPAVKRSRTSPMVAFGLLVVFALAIPWALSFDLYYLTGLDDFFATRDVLVYGVALALVVATTGTVGFLLLYALRGQGAPAEEAAKAPARNVRDILAPYGLTPRELEVAEYLSRGRSARKIAEEMFLSEASIRAHTQHIYRKMGIHSKQEFLDCVDEAHKA